MLQAITYRSGCLFVVAPDVVADARATLRLFDRWEPVLRCVWATVNEDDVEPGQLVHQPSPSSPRTARSGCRCHGAASRSCLSVAAPGGS